ncbi:MAG: hypothetical protein A2103_03825 [Gammaproteobacteria bacterium GWF2_41_13]|nr:MAG: hypothetical protein A2103_03825 [Gammaproteobacteria bacterium GWF2_41_13]
MKKMIHLFMLAVFMLISGCFLNSETYQSSVSVKPMTVPTGLSSSKIDSYYKIPNLPPNQQQAQVGGVKITPPGAQKHPA